MTNCCTLEQIQTLVFYAENFSPNEVQEVVECFSFESMININILNHELLRLHILFLKQLILHDIFYRKTKPIKHTMTFILSNLQIFKDDHLHDILGWLLGLLRGLIQKYQIFSDAFSICSLWVLTEGIEILLENNEEHILLKLLQVLDYIFSKFDTNESRSYQNIKLRESIENSIEILWKNSDIILSFSNRECLRENSMRIFCIVLFKQPINSDWEIRYENLTQLPVDPLEWVNLEPETFLRICYSVCSHFKVIWPPLKIVNVIKSLIYSLQRFSLKTSLLKIICFIYPFVLPECINEINVILGDDILILLTKRFYELDDVFSPHISQLNWILLRGECSLKEAVICYWLKNDNDKNVLIKCLMQCEAQNILIKILINPFLDDKSLYEKVADLVKSMGDFNLNTQIAKMLPVYSGVPKSFRRLMITNPAVPEDKELSKRLCKFMSLHIIFLADEYIFGLACDYSKNLLTYLKHDVDVVNMFCGNYKTILLILKRLKKFNEETAVKTMGLIKVLLLIQKRNHTEVDTPIEIDLSYFLEGSRNKLEKGLDILHLLTCQNLFIRLSQESINKIFTILFSFCQDPRLASMSFTCLTQILKCNNWLSTTATLNIFIETNCSLAVDKVSWQEFLEFLTTWIKILRKRLPTDSPFYLAHTGIIRNYIKRLPGFPKKKVNHLLIMLEHLDFLKPKSTNYYSIIKKY
ncbi:uncharacterized protein LOC130897813 isoform X2 [Diorhabda carinulata]|uniref:uncharacterized protein LOC130897813 isoform X2 n=1 Tax=Diorhabda carinulata TaxID=1163345 RepID=UPI0025A13555|nr:uncharacterized protein LOC130897813 isoform X2 [Diorhabda carinulata]